MDNLNKLERLIKYMKEEFGVTPDNIDEKLEEVRKNYIKRTYNEYI